MKNILAKIISVPVLAGVLGIIILTFLVIFYKNSDFQFNNLKTIKKGITVSSPESDGKITSPAKITGYVNGDGWIGFEGQVGTVELIDENNNSLGTAVLMAKTEWTELPIEFEANLEFNKIIEGKGNLIFRNENPSGMDSNSRELKLPVVIGVSNPETIKLKVYFNNNNLDPEISCNKVFNTERIVAKTEGVARAAIEELLKGPTEAEKSAGYYTNINAGTNIQKLIIENGTAKVDFNNKLESGIGGSCMVSAIRAQITETLKQFNTIQNVVISIDGRTEDILQP